MKLQIIPATGATAAAARIRAHQLGSALRTLGHEISQEFNSNCDILYVQKRVSPEIVKMALRARDAGVTVIYDVDDLGDELWYWVPKRLCHDMILAANVVTTDTEQRARILKQRYGVRHVEVVPDSIDCMPVAISKFIDHKNERLKVLWFGNGFNLCQLQPYLNTLKDMKDIELIVCTQSGTLPELGRRYPWITLWMWGHDSFPKLLQSCDISLLTHSNEQYSSLKSNNKMITSIAFGVPAIVTDTPEYARTARDIGMPQTIFRNEVELRDVIELMRDTAERSRYLDAAQPKIWTEYGAINVAKLFLEVASKAAKIPKNQYIFNKGLKSRYGLIQISTTTRLSKIGNDVHSAIWRMSITDDRRAEVRAILYRLKEKISGFRLYGIKEINAKKTSDNNCAIRVRERDYVRDWIRSEGAEYRKYTYERQNVNGKNPLISNPTINEVLEVLKANGARRVLEVGCGWGRLISQLAFHFEVAGCDVSSEMLALCPSGLKVAESDITKLSDSFVMANKKQWDVVFTRGVMLYFMEDAEQMISAMNGLMLLATKKIIIWEWPEVCDAMKQICSSNLFEYHPIEHRAE